jgi:ribonuclease BN (tRNA processing enzyme)
VYDFREVPVGLDAHGVALDGVVGAHRAHREGADDLRADGRSLTYSGDTGVCDDLVELARGTDVFLCEASWPHSPDNPPDVHLSGRQAGEHAQRAEVRRLLLTHLVAFTDPEVIVAEARAAFDGEVERAACGTTIQV